MEKQQTDPQLVQISAQIIVYSGNAREKIDQALKAANADDMAGAQQKLDEAENDLNQAHHVHMKLLQSESKGDPLKFSILLTHAQDTLMVTMSEMHMAKHMLKLYQKIAEKK
jgi:cellobiose PTS system EIIA component